MGIFDTVSQILSGKKPPVVAHPPKRKIEKTVSPRPQLEQIQLQEQLRLAQAEARDIIIEAKDEALKIKNRIQEELRHKEEFLDRKQGAIEEREKLLQAGEEKINERLKELEQIKIEQLQKLERAAHLTRDEARNLILKAVEESLQEDIAKRLREAEENAREDADKKAREILVDAMKHGATDYVAEYTISTVKLPDEEMKGRIIGKEGRNIRTFEQVTGVDVDLDETPGEVRLSSFDPIRREVAKVSLRHLIVDGRIQPSRIEEFVAKAKSEIERETFEAGKQLCHAVSVFNLPREIMQMLGRFKYRFSYGQNMIVHTLEETKLGIALAHEVGANVDTVRLGCLLHDIGKVITDEEGSHVELGVKFLTRFQIPQGVLDCVAQHHEDQPISTKEAALVYIADAISGSRPGARYEEYEKRLKKLEEFATSFPGVTEAYAIQAGREVRVIVNPEQISDAAVEKLAHDLREKIEKEMTYPGTVKVTVIREIRATDVAK